jgi:hypothetical protein
LSAGTDHRPVARFGASDREGAADSIEGSLLPRLNGRPTEAERKLSGGDGNRTRLSRVTALTGFEDFNSRVNASRNGRSRSSGSAVA